MRTLTLTRTDIEEILQHTHWIASKNGNQQRFLADKYPGWSMGDLMRVLIDNKSLIKARPTATSPAHFSGYQVRAKLTTIEISPN
jgi:hypothetical protein